MMFKTLLVAIFIISITAYPIDDDSYEDEPAPKRKIEEPHETQVIHLERDLAFVKYIETFKELMSQYVKSQYKSLTIDEMAAVRSVLEEFLYNFAKDLRKIIANVDEEDDEVDDGIPDESFDDVKVNIRNEFPDISEESAEQIVKKLRKNLVITRQKLDSIVRNSEMAANFNSS